jgi:hypothetical protein
MTLFMGSCQKVVKKKISKAVALHVALAQLILLNAADILQKWHINCSHNYCGRKNEQGRVLTMYTSTKIKRSLVLLLMIISLVFAGAQSTLTAKAGAPCDMVCEKYIDPTDGQCYTRCCPENEECKIRCVIMPCEK